MAQVGLIDPTDLTRPFTTLLHRAEFRRIRFHDLRLSAVTLLLAQEGGLIVIKEFLGHAHIGVTTGVYAHMRLRPQGQVINALSPTGNDPEDPTRHSRPLLTLPSALPSRGPWGLPEPFRQAFENFSEASGPTEISLLIPEHRNHPHHRGFLEHSEKISQRLAILQSRQKLGLDSLLVRLALEHPPRNI
ncbi:tyrosine-type recombinase/integrase [Streptomyces alkaliphilus]|uniref:tyrosine-type recombinase/integrase n=1 Tax=Streptomyces alkaliphilus TaxID=1472722 RepID=UPI00117DA667|nr:tyrosine-type recombinase/integrase [Streptomyces alkaliphilus]MQS06853.1 tyrosine-type recombinase/integrase [Streptomyces alkaliphilus]